MPRQIDKKQITLFALTWPIFIEIFLHMLMGNADTFMLSQYSDESVAAAGVANQILNLVIVMFGFIATGSVILITQNLGAGKEKTAKEVAVMSLITNFIIGSFISAILFFFSKPILSLMNLSPSLLDEGNQYLGIVGTFIVIQALIMTGAAVLRSYGFTKDTMYITILMNVLNVAGNYTLIFGAFGLPELGIQGAAISTAASRILGLVIIGFVLIKRIPALRESLEFNTRHLINLLKIGVPSAGEQLSYNMSQMAITFFVAMIGTEALTTKIYAQNLMMFIFLFSISVSQGTQILVGRMVGAKKYEEAFRRCMKSLYLAIGASVLMAVIVSTGSDSLFGLFTSNQEIIQTGGMLILLTVLLEPGRAFNLVIIGALRAAGDVKFPVYMGLISMWGISVPVAYVLGIHFGFGLAGIWIAFILDEWTRGILMYFRWKSRAWVSKGFVEKGKPALREQTAH
ncbi:MATE family efflux transporter [Bacillus mangrovi]|uniref:MATE family efflux transporter n=1 Tax=Metabacillus mangrovi TaxID=1491830 RepID=A0A7X2S4E0_9BACI|nr:MATE family efflux transporter [Metabacillus mangrovi]MTH53300.1 MATE family efflux transporter [Metabacillus mangrovi]